MKERILRFLTAGGSGMEEFLDTKEAPDADREAVKEHEKELEAALMRGRHAKAVVRAEQKGFYRIYRLITVASCIAMAAVLLFCVAHLPLYGQENPRANEVVERYVESGLQETGATNIVAGMILDYRAFDTLGESHVLFTALICVTILLGIDRKNMRRGYEDYYTVSLDRYFDTSKDVILRCVGMVVVPCLLIYGIYILLNGQLSPGGGFSGGAVMGAALIIYSASAGFPAVDRVFTAKRLNRIAFFALAFYSFAKGYVFFTGANGLENHIPKGTPGAILSGGLILPLDIAVGLVVASTMYGFYSLFRRGRVGSIEGTRAAHARGKRKDTEAC